MNNVEVYDREQFVTTPKSVDEIFQLLSIEQNSVRINQTLQCPWIFRGVNNVNHPLIPSIYRLNNNTNHAIYDDLIANHGHHYYHEVAQQQENRLETINTIISNSINRANNNMLVENMSHIIKSHWTECLLTDNFIRTANQIGLYIPETKLINSQPETQSISEYFRFRILSNTNIDLVSSFLNGNDERILQPNWGRDFIPDLNIVPFALARHHRIPSRLLDWTDNSLYALFFSVVFNRNIDDNSVPCVWMYNLREDIDRSRRYFHIYDNLPTYGLEFLQKQKGLFLVMRGANEFRLLHGRWPSIDEYLWVCSSFEGISIENLIRCIQIKSDFIPEIIERLRLHNISQATLMPTFDNIAIDVLEQFNLA